MPERGFTLLEIMLVIFLIGLASAGVVQTFATDSESPAKKAAQDFLTRFAQFKDRAVIEGKTPRCANRPAWLPVYAASSGAVVARFLDPVIGTGYGAETGADAVTTRK